jgi:hypothetical protein
MGEPACTPIHSGETVQLACEACAALRETLRMCLGALSKYYGEELARNDPKQLAVSDLVKGGVVLRAERALRLACTCRQDLLLDLAY